MLFWYHWGFGKDTLRTVEVEEVGKCQCWESKVMNKLSELFKESDMSSDTVDNGVKRYQLFEDIFDALSKHRPNMECFELSKISDVNFNYFRTIYVAETVAAMETIYPTEGKKTKPAKKSRRAKEELKLWGMCVDLKKEVQEEEEEWLNIVKREKENIHNGNLPITKATLYKEVVY